ncbi:MAG: mandelate racemase, partial [Candidatus Competibacteraceae bacterium]|nr:mandelate racemase [Candidatus Competibacteraceae bacterium]
MSNAVQIRVKEIDFFQRPVTLRLPFRFGIVTLTEAPQAFVRVRVENQRGQSAWGAAAEMLAPKWFDKNPTLSNEDNFDQLRRSLSLTREGYLADSSPRTAFALFADHYPQQTAACAAEDLNELVASFGPAVIDRAILDALCRLENITYQEAIRHNLPAIDPAQLSPDLAGFDLTAWLASLKPRNNIYARHTVGLVDPITAAEQENPVQDGLPETLEEVIAAYGQRYFKLKVGGDVEADIDRLSRIAAVLDRSPEPYYATLDGNEQYADSEGILALWQALSENPGLQRLAASILFIEQPISRTNALSQDIHRLSAAKPVIIDESDA